MSSSAADGFRALGVCAELSDACVALGWRSPTEIQQQAIPLALAGARVAGRYIAAGWTSSADLLCALRTRRQRRCWSCPDWLWENRGLRTSNPAGTEQQCKHVDLSRRSLQMSDGVCLIGAPEQAAAFLRPGDVAHTRAGRSNCQPGAHCSAICGWFACLYVLRNLLSPVRGTGLMHWCTHSNSCWGRGHHGPGDCACQTATRRGGHPWTRERSLDKHKGVPSHVRNPLCLLCA